jgi:hypothetical protein
MATQWEGYQMLAIAVLEQAWRDAQKPCRGADGAKEFLLTPSPLLKHWSHQAGMSHLWVIEKARNEFSG